MVFLFISQNLNFWMSDIDNKNNETSWIFELIFKKSTLWTKNWICNTHFNIVFEFWSKQTVKQIFCLTLSVGVVDVPKTHKTMQNNGRIIVIFDLKTPVINRSGAKYVQGVRMVPQGLLLLELWLLFNWEVESQTIGAMGRINGQVIFPYLPVAHCLEFRLNFIGMNEMNWNKLFHKSTFCPTCTFIPDLSRIEVQLLKLHDNLPEKSFHCQSIIYNRCK